jgi:hypothetical protein
MASLVNRIAAISAADAKVILVICFSIWRQKPGVRLNAEESGEPWETFHHAPSTKREHLRSHMVMAAARLREDASGAELQGAATMIGYDWDAKRFASWGKSLRGTPSMNATMMRMGTAQSPPDSDLA